MSNIIAALIVGGLIYQGLTGVYWAIVLLVGKQNDMTLIETARMGKDFWRIKSDVD